MALNWFKFASPASFYPIAGRLVPLFWVLTAVLVGLGLYWGFFETVDRLGGSNAQKDI